MLLLDFCKQTNLRILNGRFGSDSGIGKFTCHRHRGESIVDYILTSTDILPLVYRFSVGDPNILTDHSIINFSLLEKRSRTFYGEAVCVKWGLYFDF